MVVSSTLLYCGSDNFGGSEQDLIAALFCPGVDQCVSHTLTPVQSLLVGTQRVSASFNSFIYINIKLTRTGLHVRAKQTVCFPFCVSQKIFCDRFYTVLELISRSVSLKKP